jgi:putative two-component system response regulator
MTISATGTTRNRDRPTILIVDDTPDNIMLLSRLLKDRYNTKVAAGDGACV